MLSTKKFLEYFFRSSKAYRLVFFSTFSLLLTGGFYLLFLNNIMNNYFALIKKEKYVTNNLKQDSDLIKRLNTLKIKVRQVDKRMSNARKISKNALLIAARASAQKNISVTTISSLKSSQSTSSYKLVAQGSYHAIIYFFGQLMSLLPNLEVNRLEITGGREAEDKQVELLLEVKLLNS